MGVTETLNGVYVPAYAWCQLIYDLNPHTEYALCCPVDPKSLDKEIAELLDDPIDFPINIGRSCTRTTTVTSTMMTMTTKAYFCWTCDYAKLPKATLAGWQEVSVSLNPASSSNYHVNVAYEGPESLLELNRNCEHDLELLNQGSFSPASTTNVCCHTEVLVDFSAYNTLLDDPTPCFYCDGHTKTPTCNSETLAMGNVTVECYDTLPLDTRVDLYYPNSALKTHLYQMKLDWLLHGKKAIANNYLNILYTSFTSTKRELGTLWRTRHAEFLQHFRSKVRSSFVEVKKGSFKLSGTEASSFFASYTNIVPTLCQRTDTVEIMDKIAALFSEIGKPRRQKNLGVYIPTIKRLSREILILWVSRFGHSSLVKKKYLHGIMHLWEIEKYSLENNLPTLESYTMQGREHKHKILGAYRAKHFSASETKKSGPKQINQQDTEEQEAIAEIELETRVGQSWLYNARSTPKLKLLEQLPGVKGVANLAKSDIVAIGKGLVVKQAIREHRIQRDGQAHMTRTATYHLVTRSYRDLKNCSLYSLRVESVKY
jgi:hypothetical protein